MKLSFTVNAGTSRGREKAPEKVHFLFPGNVANSAEFT